MEIIKDLKKVLKITETVKETNLQGFTQIQHILNKWIEVFEDFKKNDTTNFKVQENKKIPSKTTTHTFRPRFLYIYECCLKQKLNTLIFLCPYPCANISKEKQTHKCLKCAKPYYPLLFKKNEGWTGVTLTKLKCRQLQLNAKLLQKNQNNTTDEIDPTILKKI